MMINSIWLDIYETINIIPIFIVCDSWVSVWTNVSLVNREDGVECGKGRSGSN